MPKLGDSRTVEGPGLIPAQDHRPDIDVEKRSCHVALRIIDLREEMASIYHVDDEELRGDVQGLSVWTLDDRSTSPRPCVMWRHAWPSIVEEFGDSFTEEPPPADAFPNFPGDGGSWTPGAGDGGQNQYLHGTNPIGDPSVWGGGNNPPATWKIL